MQTSIGKKFTPITLLQFALPSMIMMIFMSLYTIVDGIFVSRLVGSGAMSAVNMVYPVASIMMAAGIMLATGGSAIVAKEMGGGEAENAREDFTFLVVTGLVIAVIFLVAGSVFAEPFSYLLGANENLIGYCTEYLKIIMYFAPAGMLQMLFQAFFVTAGKPNLGLAVIVLAGITNAVLDYVFMGPMAMGIAGAAVATGLGQSIPAVVGMIYFLFGKGELHFTKFRPDWKKLLLASTNGASEMVTNISNAVITYLFNIILMKMAGEDGVAAISIILYAQFLFNSLYMGFAMGTAPVVSFNYGAGKKEELKKVTKICRNFVLLSSAVVTVLSFLFCDTVTAVFVDRGTRVFEMTAAGYMIFSISYLFSGYNIYTSSWFTAISDGKTSAIVSFTRTFGCIVVALLTLPRLFGLNGVWLAIPVAEFVTVILCVYEMSRGKKRLAI